jgi:hypothetical protein
VTTNTRVFNARVNRYWLFVNRNGRIESWQKK